MDVPGFALIPGAGSGIGRACALAFAAEGSEDVALPDINESGLVAVKAETNGTANGATRQRNKQLMPGPNLHPRCYKRRQCQSCR